MKTSILYIILTLFAYPCISQPNISSPLKFGTVTYYSDCVKKNVFYKPAPAIALKFKRNEPLIRLYSYEYTGNNLFGDAEKIILKYYLEFELTAVGIDADSVKMLKKYLDIKNNRAVTLIGLPVSNMTSKLLIKQLGVANNNDTISNNDIIQELKNGQLDIGRSDFEDDTKWKDKKFQIKIDDLTYQLLEHAFKNNLQICSFNYSYEINKCGISDGIYLKSKIIDTALTLANSFPIYIDSKYAEDVIEHIKLDAGSNAVLAKMEVIDYGFFEETTTDIISKRVVIKANGYSNTTFHESVKFSEGDFTSFSKYITFSKRINIRKPFFYQVIVVDKDENSFSTDWISSADWFSTLDITAINPKNKL